MATSKDAPARYERSPYPYNFSLLREGVLDPTLDKKIKWLIDSDDDYIVYVDDDDYVEWTMNSNERMGQTGDLLTRVAVLESVDTRKLKPPQIEIYKRLIGEGVVRMFDKNLTGAKNALDQAERWISARAQEAARIDSLIGATIGLVLVAVPFAVVVGYMKYVWDALEALVSGRQQVVTAAALGALGAWLSVLQRSGSTWLDLGAESRLYALEGTVRILIGSVGGAFVALLIRSGEVLTSAKSKPALFAAVCLVAGLSERLVSTLAGALEGRVGSGPPSKPPSPETPPPPAPDAAGQPPAAAAGKPTLDKNQAFPNPPIPPP